MATDFVEELRKKEGHDDFGSVHMDGHVTISHNAYLDLLEAPD